MSSSLAANSGSFERLKVRMRCGWRSCAAQIRCTERKEMPGVLAIARPVQWVASPGGSAQVSATTRARSASPRRRLAGLAGLVAQQALDPGLGEPPLPAPDRRPADPGAPGDLGDVQPVGRAEDDPSPRHVLLGAVAIGDDRLQTSTILSRDQRTHDLSHAPSIAHPLCSVNPLFASVH